MSDSLVSQPNEKHTVSESHLKKATTPSRNQSQGNLISDSPLKLSNAYSPNYTRPSSRTLVLRNTTRHRLVSSYSRIKKSLPFIFQSTLHSSRVTTSNLPTPDPHCLSREVDKLKAKWRLVISGSINLILKDLVDLDL